MRPVTLFIAVSLDGCLADQEGGVDWLAGQDPAVQDLDTYPEVIREGDTVIMGWNTYHQVTTQLAPGAWPYGGLTAYVVTHRAPPPAAGVTFTDADPCRLVRELRETPGRGIWICGGADIVQPLVAEDLINVYRLSVIPSLLGGGKRLFGPAPEALPLRLTGCREGNGIVELTYVRRGAVFS